MKITLLLLLLAGSTLGEVFPRVDMPSCYADNCAKAVTGTREGTATVAAHRADCSSFLKVTTNYKAHIIIRPTAVPSYASACSGTSRYSSACSCWGISAVTVGTLSSSSTTSTPTSHTTSKSSTSTTSSSTSHTSSTSSSTTSHTSSTSTSSTSHISPTSTSSTSHTSSTSSTSTSSISTSSTSTSTTSTSTTSTSTTSTSSTSTLTTSTSSTSTLTTSTLTTTATPTETLTSVVIQVISTPASCYQLPTPTSSLTAVSNDATTNTTLDSPITLYLGENGTSPQYFSLIVNGSSYLYDISNLNQLAIISATGNSILINENGIYLFSSDCSTAVAVTIPNFFEQVAAITNSTNGTSTKRSADLIKRTQTPFSVDVALQDQCGNPRTDLSATLQIGTSSCTLENAVSGVFDFMCTYPGLKSSEQNCENGINGFFNFFTTGFIGGATNWGAIAGLIAKIVPATILGRLAAGIVAVLGGEEIVLGLAVLAVLETIVAPFVPGIASDICTGLFLNQPMDLIAAAGTAVADIAIVTAAPASPVMGTLTISDPSMPSCTCAASDTNCGKYCANLLTDANNCGTCGNVCASGSCDDGTCTTSVCDGATCDSYTFDCSPNSACFCAQTSEGTGACAVPNTCDFDCSSTADCGEDSVCAINTCCGAAGTCTSSVSACGPDVPPERLMVRGWGNGTQAHRAFGSS